MKRKSKDVARLHCTTMLAGLHKELDGPVEPAVTASAALLRTQFQAMELKRLYRQGWLKRGVAEGETESVADHVFGTAILALLLAGHGDYAGLDRDKVLRMVLVHELGEVYTGDITPVDGVSPEEKHRLELDSLEKVLGDTQAAFELRALWQEFEDGSSAEARFVRELDRLEMGLQAAVYQADGSTRMEEFYDSARRTVQAPRLRGILELAIAGAGACG